MLEIVFVCSIITTHAAKHTAAQLPPNEAVFVRLLFQLRPNLRIVIEQPAQSWALKQPYMKILKKTLRLLLDSCVVRAHEWNGSYDSL